MFQHRARIRLDFRLAAVHGVVVASDFHHLILSVMQRFHKSVCKKNYRTNLIKLQNQFYFFFFAHLNRYEISIESTRFVSNFVILFSVRNSVVCTSVEKPKLYFPHCIFDHAIRYVMKLSTNPK